MKNIKMNLNKFTKAELISKLKQQNVLNQKLIDKVQNVDTKLQEKSWIRTFLDSLNEILIILNLIKELFLKITLLSFLIKLIRKFPIIQTNLAKLWKLIRNFMFFGFSTAILDIFNFDYFKKTIVLLSFIYDEALETLSDFLKDVRNYWFKKSDTDSESDSDEDSNEMNIFVNDSLESKINSENKGWNWYSIAYYTSIIVAGCLIFVYWNEIKEILDNFKKDGPDDNNSPKDIDLVDIKGKAKETFSGDPLKYISETFKNKTYFEVTSANDELTIKTDDKTINFNKTRINDEEVFEYIPKASSSQISPTGSTSSVETITTNIDKLYNKNLIEDLTGKSIMYKTKVLSELGDLTTLVNENWKVLIDQNVKEVIDFIEINFPGRIFDRDTDFIIQSLIKIENLNEKMLTDLLLYSNNRSEEEKLLIKLITGNLNSWIDEKRNLIRNLNL